MATLNAGRARGLSAYEIAKKKGYDGTEKEWLSSLIGKDGKSAYELALEHGFKGSEEEWLESLRAISDSSTTCVNTFSDLPENLEDGTLGYVLNDSEATGISNPDLLKIPLDDNIESVIEQEYIAQGGTPYDENWYNFRDNYTNCNLNNVTLAEPKYNPDMIHLYGSDIEIGTVFGDDHIGEIHPVGMLVGSVESIGEYMGFVTESQYKYFPLIMLFDRKSDILIDGQRFYKLSYAYGYCFDTVTGHLLNSELDDTTVFTIEKGWFECYVILNEDGEPTELKIESAEHPTIPHIGYAECECEPEYIDVLRTTVGNMLLSSETVEKPKGLYVSVNGEWLAASSVEKLELDDVVKDSENAVKNSAVLRMRKELLNEVEALNSEINSFSEMELDSKLRLIQNNFICSRMEPVFFDRNPQYDIEYNCHGYCGIFEISSANGNSESSVLIHCYRTFDGNHTYLPNDVTKKLTPGLYLMMPSGDMYNPYFYKISEGVS